MPWTRFAGLALLIVGGCAGEAPRGPTPFVPGPIGAGAAAPAAEAAPAPGTVLRDRADVTEACRAAADRVILTRDRGQLLREDERDARVGSQASIFAQRAETDRLGRIFERDRLAADCVGQNSRDPATPR